MNWIHLFEMLLGLTGDSSGECSIIALEVSLRKDEIEWDRITITAQCYGLSICSSGFMYANLYPQNSMFMVFGGSASKKWLVHPTVHL